MTSPIDTNNVVADLIWNLEQAVEYDTRLQETEGVSAVAIYTAGERRLAARQSLSDRIDVLDAECERAWGSYRIAVDQAMANGQALADLRASLTQGGNT